MEELNERSKQILETVISSYIATAGPVGSRTIIKRSNINLSPATVRNIMSDLEEMGFLSHPHTSAGRVPTDKAYRFYVDSILKRIASEGEFPLSLNTDEELKENRETMNVENIMKWTSHYLSQFSNYIGIIIAPKFSSTIFQHIEFINLRKHQILAIFVTKSGIVQHKVIKNDEDLPQDALDKITKYLNEKFQGMALQDIRMELEEMMAEEKRTYDRLVEKAYYLGRLAFLSPEEEEIYFDGTANILSQPEFFNNVDEMKRIFSTLEQKSLLLRILDKCLDSDGMQIFIGSESPVKETHGLSFITSVYKSRERVLGTLGVIGPKRMDYFQIIPLVNYTANLLSKLFTEAE